MRAKIWRKLQGKVLANRLPLVLGVVLVAVAIAVSYSPAVVPVPPADAQNIVPNMSGWAWSSNIGWISVSCANSTRGCTDWGLRLEDEVGGKRAINGYAWNDKIGWIKFNPNGASANKPPAAPYPVQLNTVAAPTYLDTATNRLVGWARACNVFEDGCAGNLKPDADRGGWDGWISLGRTDSEVGLANGTQNPYGVIAVAEGNDLKFKYHAWGQTVIGWMNMAPASGVNGVACVGCVNDNANKLTLTITGELVSTVKAGNATCRKLQSIVSTYTCEFTATDMGGSVVTLEATTDDFQKWTGDASSCGSNTSCQIDISAGSKTAIASFFKVPTIGGGDGNCSDGIQNGNETGVDTGGRCGGGTGDGNCSDGIQNGNETGIDTGGRCDSNPPPGPRVDLEVNGEDNTTLSNPLEVRLGSDVTLSWTSSRTSSCSTDWSDTTTTSGSELEGPLDIPGNTYVYGIDCNGATDRAYVVTSDGVCPATPDPTDIDCDVAVSCLKPIAIASGDIVVNDGNTPTNESPQKSIRMAVEADFSGDVTLAAKNLPNAGSASSNPRFTTNPANPSTSYTTVSSFSVFFPDTQLNSNLRSAFADGGPAGDGVYNIEIEATTSGTGAGGAQCIENTTPETRTIRLKYIDTDSNPAGAQI